MHCWLQVTSSTQSFPSYIHHSHFKIAPLDTRILALGHIVSFSHSWHSDWAQLHTFFPYRVTHSNLILNSTLPHTFSSYTHYFPPQPQTHFNSHSATPVHSHVVTTLLNPSHFPKLKSQLKLTVTQAALTHTLYTHSATAWAPSHISHTQPNPRQSLHILTTFPPDAQS